ncbi:formate hydrogenlyase maturation HycH family protein [Photobacterium leiognathi]|uniref:formate hydrogenlyase maturation HycH family protein n=1 Tax=Photobacterium leiognathi TaxID=553611 RepID=UPI002738D179|nr:formate hydrogenlyase maturation HycH family protein [Photobacterium leiognathi]
MKCSGYEYLEWISGLDQSGEAFRKMKGFLVFGEITIYSEHLNMLALAFDRIDSRTQDEKSQQLTSGFIDALGAIHREPTMGMMIRGGR